MVEEDVGAVVDKSCDSVSACDVVARIVVPVAVLLPVEAEGIADYDEVELVDQEAGLVEEDTALEVVHSVHQRTWETDHEVGVRIENAEHDAAGMATGDRDGNDGASLVDRIADLDDHEVVDHHHRQHLRKLPAVSV